MYPFKTYIGTKLISGSSICDSSKGEAGVLMLYFDNEQRKTISFQFYMNSEGNVEAEGRQLHLQEATADVLVLADKDSAYHFDISKAFGVHHECFTTCIMLPTFPDGLNELYLIALKKASDEIWKMRSDNQMNWIWFREEVEGLLSEYRLRDWQAGNRHEKPWILDSEWVPSRYGLYGEGDEVAFTVKGQQKRGVIKGLDFMDKRYTRGEIVDIFCAEETVLYKEISMADICGVFSGDLEGYVDRNEALLKHVYPPIQDSLWEGRRKFFAAYDGVVSDTSWPGSKYRTGQIVRFREHSKAPYERGVIVSEPLSRGDWGPRGAYYGVRCPYRLTTITRLPENNIFSVLEDSAGLSEEELNKPEWQWLQRDDLCWNEALDGGCFMFYPESRKGLISEAEQGIFSSKWDKLNAFCAAIDEFVVDKYLFDCLKRRFDPTEKANIAIRRRDGLVGDVEFEYYDDNFFSCSSICQLIQDIQSLPDHSDFYGRF